MMFAVPITLALSLTFSALPAAAHEKAHHGGKKAAAVKKEQTEWGIAGEAKAADRVVKIKMLDTMRFAPDSIEVKQGETIKFVVINSGRMLHEIVIGSHKELNAHAALMAKFPGMKHEESYMAHVASGKIGQIVWTFNRVGEFMFACLIPGHYQAGMVGKIKVTAM